MSRPKFSTNSTVARNRKLVLEAFKNLRKQGLIARANFLCCSNCAGSEIESYVSNLPEEKAKRIKGCVFWHKQDEDDIWRHGEMYLAYGSIDSSKHGEVGLPTKEVGELVVRALKEQGLSVEWDGDPHVRILVNMTVPSEVRSKPKLDESQVALGSSLS